MRTVNSEEFIDSVVNETLELNPKANIVIIGPSTLERDHSLLYFSDILSGTDTNLIVVDLPPGTKKKYHGSLKTVRSQMQSIRKKHHNLKKPKFIGQNVYFLDERISQGSIDIIYDHSSLPYISVNRPPCLTDYDKAVSEVIRIYSNLIRTEGKLIIMDYYGFSIENEGYMKHWKNVLESLKKNKLTLQIYCIDKDIDLRKKFPEITKMRGHENDSDYTGFAPQYQCKAMVIATKRKKC